MNSDPNTNSTIFIGVIYCIGSIYAFWVGISVLKKNKIINTRIYKNSFFISKLIPGEQKTLEVRYRV